MNVKREYDVKLQVYGENAKLSHITSGDSALRSPNMRSPVQDYSMKSPDYSASLVDSQMKSGTGDKSSRVGDTSRSYGLAESGHSGTGVTRQADQSTSRGASSSVSGSGVYQSGYSLSLIHI